RRVTLGLTIIDDSPVHPRSPVTTAKALPQNHPLLVSFQSADCQLIGAVEELDDSREAHTEAATYQQVANGCHCFNTARSAHTARIAIRSHHSSSARLFILLP